MTAADQSPGATGEPSVAGKTSVTGNTNVAGEEPTELIVDRGVDVRAAGPPVGMPDGAGLAGGPGGSDATDLVAQIRQLAGSDPADVQRVIGDVLAALDRVTGGRLRGQLPSDPGREGGRTADPG